MRRERTYDRIYYNKELVFSRKTSYEFRSRNFYCVSPLDLTMALIEVMKDIMTR
jgi:CCR4-NOT transcriptional regulation complex NOT5 subunit